MATSGTDQQGIGRLAGSAVDLAYSGKKNIKAEEEAVKKRLALLDSLDWQPEYASQHVPTYQKTQSPIARSYLESMLLGQNPDSTFSGATNAKYKKAAQQRTMDSLYGSMPQRAAESARVQQETPWQVTPPTRQIAPPKALTVSERRAQAEQDRAMRRKRLLTAQQGEY
jgi:hypothetical protein